MKELADTKGVTANGLRTSILISVTKIRNSVTSAQFPSSTFVSTSKGKNMNIVITGSIGHIGKPLTRELVRKGHLVTVITSKDERKPEIKDMGAKAAIGTFQDVDFLTHTFNGADIVYLMEAWEGIGSIFDKAIDFVAAFNKIGNNYKGAIERSGVKKVVHLSSIVVNLH